MSPIHSSYGNSPPAFELCCGGPQVQDPDLSTVFQAGNLKLDLRQRLLWRGEEIIHLTPKEFDLLSFLMKNMGASLTHVKLLRTVWGP